MLAFSAVAALGVFALSGSTNTQPPPPPVPPKPGGTKPATGGGTTVTGDLVISVYALRPAAWSQAWEGFSGAQPRLVEWSGESQSGSGHPTWQFIGDRMRDSSGRLLPALLRQWNADGAERIAAVGFSAGSNSGLRQLLWHPEDRARLDAVFAIDGLHPSVNAAGELLDPRQLEGLRAYATAAAAGGRLAVATASNVAAPSASSGKTAQMLRELTAAVATARGAALPAPPLSWLGTSPPPESIVTQAQALGLVDAAQLGGFSAWWFSGADAAAHIRQAQNVLPLLLRSYLAPRWRRGVLV